MKVSRHSHLKIKAEQDRFGAKNMETGVFLDFQEHTLQKCVLICNGSSKQCSCSQRKCHVRYLVIVKFYIWTSKQLHRTRKGTIPEHHQRKLFSPYQRSRLLYSLNKARCEAQSQECFVTVDEPEEITAICSPNRQLHV